MAQLELSLPPFLFPFHSITFSFNPNQWSFFFNPMQCYFWDADCFAHNSSVLHLVGVVNERNDGWYRRFTCGIHAKLGWGLLSIRQKKGGHKATIEKKHHENLDRKKKPQDQFFLFICFLFLFWMNCPFLVKINVKSWCS